ncbi:MAG: hypothetical protein H6672_12415 [Anaerolineaceae bacterium]|nr:hypothetical protein [Anaerolineaceae bacterium]
MSKRVIIIALWLFALLITASCQPATEQAVADNSLVGTWMTGHYYCIRFQGDGTYQAAGSMEGLDIASPPDSGTYTIQDGYVTLISSAGSRDCSSGDVGYYQVTTTSDGSMEFTMQEDFCKMRRSPLSTTFIFEPMEMMES